MSAAFKNFFQTGIATIPTKARSDDGASYDANQFWIK